MRIAKNALGLFKLNSVLDPIAFVLPFALIEPRLFETISRYVDMARRLRFDLVDLVPWASVRMLAALPGYKA